MPGWVALGVGVTTYVVLMVFLGLNDPMCESPIWGDLSRLVYKTVALCWAG